MAWVWELRNPDGAMLGLEFARGTSDPTDCLLAHALPERVSVTVTDDDAVVARGEGLGHHESAPMARLWVATRSGGGRSSSPTRLADGGRVLPPRARYWCARSAASSEPAAINAAALTAANVTP